MKCSNCGAELQPSANFCSNCGAKVEQANDEKSLESLIAKLREHAEAESLSCGSQERVIQVLNDLQLPYRDYDLLLYGDRHNPDLVTRLMFSSGYIELSDSNGQLAVLISTFAEVATKLFKELYENMTVKKVETAINKYLPKIL